MGSQQSHYLERILYNRLPNINGTGLGYATEDPTVGDQTEFPNVWMIHFNPFRPDVAKRHFVRRRGGTGFFKNSAVKN